MKSHEYLQSFQLPVCKNASIFVAICFICVSLLQSCSKEQAFNADEVKISSRDGVCEPGSYTESNGRLIFDNHDEYIKTMEFLSCAEKEDIDTWASGFEVETAAKDYAEFTSLVLEADDEDIEDLISEYDDKISISYNNDTTEFKPLFKILNEFCNRNGEFQIGSVVIKITAHKIISILNPGSVSPSSINDATTTDTVNKVFVYNLTPSNISGGCCPSAQGNAIYYSNSPRKRSDANYYIYNASTVRPHPTLPGEFYFDALIYVDCIGYFRKRACTGSCWVAISQQGGLIFDINFEHNYGTYGVDNPAEVYADAFTDFNTYIIYNNVNSTYTAFARGRMTELSVCVSDVHLYLINFSINPIKTLSIECE